MTAADRAVSIGTAGGVGGHTILDLPHAGLDIVQAEIGRSLLQTGEIHVRLRGEGGG